MIAIATLQGYRARPTLAPRCEASFSKHSFRDGWGIRIDPCPYTPRSHQVEKVPEAALNFVAVEEIGVTDGTRTRDLRSHNPPTPVSGVCRSLQVPHF